MENQILIHHGVKGQRWGVIRRLSQSKPIQDLTKSYVTPKKKPKLTAFDKEFIKKNKEGNGIREAKTILATGGTSTAYKSLRTAGMSKKSSMAVSWGINAASLALGYGLHKAGIDSKTAIATSMVGSKYIAEMATYNIARNSYNKKHQS
jgi:hypothetical protein|nr:MAG TPA: hypothetical protein [Caudoviricetes sp.]